MAETKEKKLVVMTHGGQQLRFDKDRIVIGSVESAEIRLSGEKVSPIHAVIELGLQAGGVAVVFDLASDGGVFVNGKKVINHALKHGDVIKIGTHEISFRLESQSKVPKERFFKASAGKKFYVNTANDLAVTLQDTDGVEDIFDYEKADNPCLEVVMSWQGTIFDIEHFKAGKNVTLGPLKFQDFSIPPLLNSDSFTLIDQRAGAVSLNLDSHMDGVIHKDGDLVKVKDLLKGDSNTEIRFERHDFAKISVGEIDFYLSYTASPPQLKRKRMLDKDPFFFKIIFSSLLLSALLITALMNIKLPETLEAEELPERIATILYQPEKYTAYKPPSPLNVSPDKVRIKSNSKKVIKLRITPKKRVKKTVPKTMSLQNQKVTKKRVTVSQNIGKEGSGEKAKGTTGTLGSKTSKNTGGPQNQAKRASAMGGNGRGKGNSQVPGEGNLDIFKGVSSKILNLLGNSANRLGKSGKKIKGYSGFDTKGGGGLALSGSGSGGGGTAESLGGLSNTGRGGGRVGTGLGAAGRGSKIVGGSTRVVLRSGGDEDSFIMGSIDKDAVEAALLAHKDEFRLCYEREINAGQPNLAGRVSTIFNIGSSGRVTKAGVRSSSLNNSNAEKCIIRVIKRIDFPIPEGAGVVQVTYPFKFRPTTG